MAVLRHEEKGARKSEENRENKWMLWIQLKKWCGYVQKKYGPYDMNYKNFSFLFVPNSRVAIWKNLSEKVKL